MTTDRDRLRRFDSDPDALAWARAKVQHQVDRLRDFERQATERGDTEQALQWRKMATMLRRQFLGGTGCVIAAFDERKPDYERMVSAPGTTLRPAVTEAPS